MKQIVANCFIIDLNLPFIKNWSTSTQVPVLRSRAFRMIHFYQLQKTRIWGYPKMWINISKLKKNNIFVFFLDLRNFTQYICVELFFIARFTLRFSGFKALLESRKWDTWPSLLVLYLYGNFSKIEEYYAEKLFETIEIVKQK